MGPRPFSHDSRSRSSHKVQRAIYTATTVNGSLKTMSIHFIIHSFITASMIGLIRPANSS